MGKFPPPERAIGDSAGDLKAKFEALGIAVRAGVAPESALERLGLTGIRLTGAVPVSLRLPDSEASVLEEK